jgi:hypothetical protein
LADLVQLGFLVNSGFTDGKYKHTRIRSLDITKMKVAARTVAPDSQVTVTPDSNSVAPDSQNACARFDETLTPDSPVRAANLAYNRPIEQPTKETDQKQPNPPTEKTNPAGVDGGRDVSLEDQEPTLEQLRWDDFIKNLPEELHGATIQKTQRPQIEKLLKSFGAGGLLTIIRRWIEHRDMPIEERKGNKWVALLEEIAPHIKPGIEEYRRMQAERAEKNAERRWAELRAKSKAQGNKDKAFLESRWSVGESDKTLFTEYLKATPPYSSRENLKLWAHVVDMLDRYDYWLNERAGTLVIDEEAQWTLDEIAKERAMQEPVALAG